MYKKLKPKYPSKNSIKLQVVIKNIKTASTNNLKTYCIVIICLQLAL